MNHRICAKYIDIELCPIDIWYSQEYRIIRNKRDNRKWFYYSDEISECNQKKWFRKYLDDETDYMWVVIYNEVVVGGVAIYNICENDGYKKAEFGRLLIDSDSKLSHGGLKACLASCYIAFNALSINELFLSVYKTNNKAISVYKEVGFIDENGYESDDVSKHMKLSFSDFMKKIGESNNEFKLKN